MANDLPSPGLVARDRAIDRLRDPVIVKFEDLLRRPEDVQDHIAAAFDFKMEGRFSEFHRRDVSEIFATLMHRVRPLDKQRLQPWRWQPERIVQQFTEAPELFDILEKRGYERDRRWFDKLKESIA